jgi:hypothetical protein
MRVARRKMRNLFSEGIDIRVCESVFRPGFLGSEFLTDSFDQYGKRLTNITKTSPDRVNASFADGSFADGNLLVGCDSAGSMTRSVLLGDEAAKAEVMDVTMLNFSVKFDVETSKMIRSHEPYAFNSYHREGRMFWVSVMNIEDREDPSTWSFQLIISWNGYPRAEGTYKRHFSY